jgi:hypothetical protein
MEKDTHDKLVEAYLEYFKASEKFETRNSERTHRATRKWLRTIRSLAHIRMAEVHEKLLAKKAANKQ